MMHEFGHGAVLEDTDTLDQDVYGDCVMSYSVDNIKETHTAITDCDVRYFNLNQLQNR